MKRLVSILLLASCLYAGSALAEEPSNPCLQEREENKNLIETFSQYVTPFRGRELYNCALQVLKAPNKKKKLVQVVKRLAASHLKTLNLEVSDNFSFEYKVGDNPYFFARAGIVFRF